MELPEDAWDENEAEDIPDEKVVDFSVDTRTVFGTIENIQDGTFIVNTGRLSPSYIVAEQFPNLKWKFESGDVVSLKLQVCKGRFDHIFSFSAES